jgi:hypothetical protein
VSGFIAPPQKDFDAFSGLMTSQANHFATLDNWSAVECSEAGDLNGLLVLPFRSLAPKIASFFTEKLGQCTAGMDDVASRAQQTGQVYQSAEQANVNTAKSIYPNAVPFFPDLGEIPGLQHLGDFTDAPVTLAEPDPAGDDTAKAIQADLNSLAHGIPLSATGGIEGGIVSDLEAGILAEANKLFQFFTGQSLVQLLISPLDGNFGRLKFLSDAYNQLSAGTYTVTGTIRKGSVHLAGEWEGSAATAFDCWMFRWSMGTGGIGDAAKVAADFWLKVYDVITKLVKYAIKAIIALINTGLKRLVETVEGDVVIEAVGGGPEDPVADVVASVWTLFKVYGIIRAIVAAITDIQNIFEEIKSAVSTAEHDFHEVISFFSGPMPSISSLERQLINQVEQRGFEFEKDSGWNPKLGALRIALLPPA